MRVEVIEVIALQQLVGELGEREAVTSFAIETLLNAVFGHHVVDGDVLTYVAGESQEGEILHPIVVVDQFGAVGSIALEVEEVRQLSLDASNVMCERLLIEQVALLALAAGVTDHASGATDEGEGLVTAALKVTQHHDTAEVTDVQTVSRRVNPHVGRNLFFLEEFLGARHHLMDHTAPGEFFYEIHLSLCICILTFMFCGRKGT